MLPHPSQDLKVTHLSLATLPRGAWQYAYLCHCHQSEGPSVAVVVELGAGGGVFSPGLWRVPPTGRECALLPA